MQRHIKSTAFIAPCRGVANLRVVSRSVVNCGWIVWLDLP